MDKENALRERWNTPQGKIIKDELISIMYEGGIIHWTILMKDFPYSQEIRYKKDLRYIDLSNLELFEVDMTSVNLTGANLSGSTFYSAHFDHAKLTKANLSKSGLNRGYLNFAKFDQANLTNIDLRNSELINANFKSACLKNAQLIDTNFQGATFKNADLSFADLERAHLFETNFNNANLSNARLRESRCMFANFEKANLSNANLVLAYLFGANLTKANLEKANLRGANLVGASLKSATLKNSSLLEASLVQADLCNADISGSLVYGTSTWDIITNEKTSMNDLIISREFEPFLTVDDIEVAHFLYLILNNDKLTKIINNMRTKAVLLLGSFDNDTLIVLDSLKKTIRDFGYLPILFNFEPSKKQDLMETVKTLALLSSFVIVDLSNRSGQLHELASIVKEVYIPFATIAQDGTKLTAMQKEFRHHYWYKSDFIPYSKNENMYKLFENKILPWVGEIDQKIRLERQ